MRAHPVSARLDAFLAVPPARRPSSLELTELSPADLDVLEREATVRKLLVVALGAGTYAVMCGSRHGGRS